MSNQEKAIQGDWENASLWTTSLCEQSGPEGIAEIDDLDGRVGTLGDLVPDDDDRTKAFTTPITSDVLSYSTGR